MKLDLGCGKCVKPGFVGVDISPESDASVIMDLRERHWFTSCLARDSYINKYLEYQPGCVTRLQFRSGSVEEAYSQHFLEHLTGPERIAFMDELWRVLVAGGKAKIITPYWSSDRAVQDPTHQWPPICQFSYAYFDREWRKRNMVDHYPIRCNFHTEVEFLLEPAVGFPDDNARIQGVKHYNNVVRDLVATLTKLE